MASPRTIAVPRVTINAVPGRNGWDDYIVTCAACGQVDRMLTALGAADMRVWHRNLHLTNRL